MLMMPAQQKAEADLHDLYREREVQKAWAAERVTRRRDASARVPVERASDEPEVAGTLRGASLYVCGVKKLTQLVTQRAEVSFQGQISSEGSSGYAIGEHRGPAHP